MEVSIDKQYPVEASQEAAWKLLSNIEELAGCMPGAQIDSKLDDTHYKGSVKVKLGPALASFSGEIEVLGLDGGAHRLVLMGKGTDKGGSSASLRLEASLLPGAEDQCVLLGQAELIVNGRFAQLGSRFLGSVSDLLLAQFAQSFSRKARALQGASGDAASLAHSVIAKASAASRPPAQARELNALSLVGTALRQAITKLFGRPG
jgi:carbon monoxide dehydrogenase subunit G